LGVLYPYHCTDEVKFGTEEGTLDPLRAKFHNHRCNVSPLRGENPQNRPLSKLNNRRFALRAMLPVTENITNRLMWLDKSTCLTVRIKHAREPKSALSGKLFQILTIGLLKKLVSNYCCTGTLLLV